MMLFVLHLKQSKVQTKSSCQSWAVQLQVLVRQTGRDGVNMNTLDWALYRGSTCITMTLRCKTHRPSTWVQIFEIKLLSILVIHSTYYHSIMLRSHVHPWGCLFLISLDENSVITRWLIRNDIGSILFKSWSFLLVSRLNLHSASSYVSCLCACPWLKN